jgi:hypothetical protein
MTTAPALPAFCGPINFDMNRDWPCRRLSFVYYLHNEARDIAETEARIGRARSERVRRNLTQWVADATERLAKHITWTDGKTCTCPAPAAYASLADVPLPDCTC